MIVEINGVSGNRSGSPRRLSRMTVLVSRRPRSGRSLTATDRLRSRGPRAASLDRSAEAFAIVQGAAQRSAPSAALVAAPPRDGRTASPAATHRPPRGRRPCRQRYATHGSSRFACRDCITRQTTGRPSASSQSVAGIVAFKHAAVRFRTCLWLRRRRPGGGPSAREARDSPRPNRDSAFAARDRSIRGSSLPGIGRRTCPVSPERIRSGGYSSRMSSELP